MDYIIITVVPSLIAAAMAARHLTVTSESTSFLGAIRSASWILIRIIAAAIAALAVILLMFTTLI